MIDAEVVVYGATSAGVAASVAAAQAGASTVLLEPGRHIGGMTSGGLGYTDVGDLRVLGGAAARLRADIGAHYGVAPGRYAGPEPHVAESILRGWLEEAGVEVVFGAWIAGVDTAEGRIRSVTLADGGSATGGVFVDASYEGDLLALAGVPYVVGREDRAKHGERFAGRRELAPGRHVFPPWVSPFRDDPDGLVPGPLLPQVKPEPLAEVGSGDGGVMSFGYRVCLTQAQDRIPFDLPDREAAEYREEYWELGRRLFDRWRRDRVEPEARLLIGLEPNLPGGKCDANSLGPFSLSVHDGSAWGYPDAGPARREELRAHHERHARGFLHFLATDGAVPAAVRRELQSWGLPREEFADTGHLPHQLYVREARRMVGETVLTEHDLVEGRRPADTIALGSYHLDIREVQRAWQWVYEHPRPIAHVVTEGYLSVPVPAYGVPYRALVPKESDVSNLLVPVCLSASHVAFSSVRMEPQYMMLGQAAGTAAAMAASAGLPVQRVDVAALRERLLAQGAVLAI